MLARIIPNYGGGCSGIAWASPFLKSLPMRYRGVSYKVVRAIDVHICWRWSFVMNDRRKSGQTKISRRAAEIQAQSAIDQALARQSRSQPHPAHASGSSNRPR